MRSRPGAQATKERRRSAPRPRPSGRCLVGASESRLEPLTALGPVPTAVPEIRAGNDEPQLRLRRLLLVPVVERHAQVVLLTPEPLELLERQVVAVLFAVDVCLFEEVLGMTSERRPAHLLLGEAVACELANRLQHREPALSLADEALVDERGERLQIALADGLRRLERPAAGEDREPRHEPPARARRAGRSSRRSSPAASAAARAASRAPPVRSGSRCSSRASRASGGRSLTRAAASSIASGRPSRRRQISATAPLAAKSGRTARARSWKRATASSSGSGGTGYCCSNVRRSGSRLVASSLRLLDAATSSARRGAQPSTCSTLSSRSRARRSRR